MKTITVGFHGADLFFSWDDADNYDVRESAALYAKLLKEKLEDGFPGVEIEVVYDLDASGVLPDSLQTRIDGLTASQVDSKAYLEFGNVREVEIDVYYDFKWAVKIGEGE